MRTLVQRVSRACVRLEGNSIASIGEGLVALVGIAGQDGPEQVEWMAGRVAKLRIFEGPDGKMSRSLGDVGGAVLCVSQFTLLGRIRKGTRPNFIEAASPDKAGPLYQLFCEKLAGHGVDVKSGQFGAKMSLELVNEGPVTVLLER